MTVRSGEGIAAYGTDDAPDRNLLTDINRDGKLDAVVCYETISKPGKLAWYEQKGEPGSTEWAEQLIGVIIGPMSHDVGDVDQDGDPDVVAGEHYVKEPPRSRLYFFENEDGRSIKWRSHIIHIGDEHHDGGKLIDIDGNGDLDVISIG